MFFFSLRISVVGSTTFCVFLLVLVRARPSYRATDWGAVLVIANRFVEAVAPLMKPWCAEVVLPTAANLNLERGRFSRVAWHSDNEPLFGERGEPKLIVSMSFGDSGALQVEGRLDHGDLLVMDGQCQDEFLHCTDPGLEQERINVTFRWIKQHVASCSFLRTGVACCLPACAQGSSVPVTGTLVDGVFFL